MFGVGKSGGHYHRDYADDRVGFACSRRSLNQQDVVFGHLDYFFEDSCLRLVEVRVVVQEVVVHLVQTFLLIAFVLGREHFWSLVQV